MDVMELALNLVWGIVALSLLAVVYRGVRRGGVQVRMASAMMLAVMICLIILPVISASDDLLDARQAGLPPSGQTWRVMAEGFASGVEVPPVALFLVRLICSLTVAWIVLQGRRSVRLYAGRCAVTERLRPPPCPAH
jgi:hypothetical protein